MKELTASARVWTLSLALALCAAAIGIHVIRPAPPDSRLVGLEAPRVTVFGADRRARPLSTIWRAHSRVILAVFSPDCESYAAEGQALEQLMRSLPNGDAIIGVAHTMLPERVAAMQRDAHVSFPVWLIDQVGVSALQADPLPAILVVDGEGTVEFEATGELSAASFFAWWRLHSVARTSFASRARRASD